MSTRRSPKQRNDYSDLGDAVAAQLLEWDGDLDIALAHAGAELAPLGTADRERRLTFWVQAMKEHGGDHPDAVGHMLDFAYTGHSVTQAAEDWSRLHPELPRLDV